MCLTIKEKYRLPIKPREIVKDPIYGYIEVFPHEVELIDTPAFQRLRRIKQLTSAHYVYPGATHSRFSHSLGAMHIAGMFCESLLRDLLSAGAIDRDEFVRYYLLVRLWGLIHDVGHGPFSHVFDEVILSKHRKNHEKMSVDILENDADMSKIISRISKFLELSMKDIVFIHETPEEPPSPNDSNKKRKCARNSDLKIVLRDVVKGLYSADIMDFLLRDAYYTGAGYVSFDWRRLLLASHIHRENIVLEKRAEDALVAFITSRFFMFRTTYYHRTTRCFDKIIYDYLTTVKDELDGWVKNTKEYVKLDENSIFSLVKKGNQEKEWLLNRVPIYECVDEKREKTEKSSKRLDVGFDFLDKELHEAANDINGDMFFVDTSDIHLNPLRFASTLFMCGANDRKPKQTSLWDILSSYGIDLPYKFLIARLYVKRGISGRNKSLLKQRFGKLFTEEIDERDTHY